MARTELTVEDVVSSGLAATYTAAASVDGNSFKNDGKTVLHVKTGATALVLTVQTPGTVDGLAVSDRTESIGINSDQFFKFLPGHYNQADGTVYIDYDNPANVTVAVLRV